MVGDATLRVTHGVPAETPHELALVALAIMVMLILAPGPFWQNNLAALTPLPKKLLATDARLRAALGACAGLLGRWGGHPRPRGRKPPRRGAGP